MIIFFENIGTLLKLSEITNIWEHEFGLMERLESMYLFL